MCYVHYTPSRGRTRRHNIIVHTIHDSCNPLFAAITWHLGLSSPSPESAEPLLSAPRALRLAAAVRNTKSVLLHLSCVGLSKRQVYNLLCRARNIGIKNIFALRGDRPDNDPSDFRYARDLVHFIRENFGNYFTICVAGYPMGHPEADSIHQDLLYLKQKVDAGADFILTQFCFEVDPFINFVLQCRKIGITVPIIPGIMLIQEYSSLLHLSRICKVEIPKAVLNIIEPIRDNQEAVRKFGVHLAVKIVSQLFSSNQLQAVHFFTLNRASSITEACKLLGFYTAEPAKSLMYVQETEESSEK
ncbi:methylenetetrahydrofolate reductase (NADPH) isoform X2 [Periplaneta americana]|uniref:methylenetetrahydrofolate reductase (NADPH) isoform X2 n=1 Tax=Periplaneta americana TaxID=6978 RepID=UPI0037E823FF